MSLAARFLCDKNQIPSLSYLSIESFTLGIVDCILSYQMLLRRSLNLICTPLYGDLASSRLPIQIMQRVSSQKKDETTRWP